MPRLLKVLKITPPNVEVRVWSGITHVVPSTRATSQPASPNNVSSTRRDLPRLTRLDPRELDGDTVGNAEIIVARLQRALRAERNRARSGHWTYDLNRHIALHQAHTAELERLRLLQAKAS